MYKSLGSAGIAAHKNESHLCIKTKQVKARKIISIVLRVIVAGILLQTLYFKFSAQPESVALFTKLHAEPFGRIGAGIAELITSILLFIPRTRLFAAIMGMGTMAGALMAHLTVIGIVSDNDGGFLFILALSVFALCAIIAFLHKDEAPAFIRKFLPQTKKS
jgi:putative oxidoreductase